MEKDTATAPFWHVMFAVFFGNFMAILSSTTINVALPVFMDDFHADIATVQWMMSGFMLSMGVIAPVIGFIGDRISYKRLYVWALAGFTVVSALCMLAWNIESLIAFRILQGLFSGIIMPTTLTIIYQVIPKERQSFGVSLWSVSAMLAPAFGPTIGGWLTEYFGWESLFALGVPIGVIAVAVALRYIPFYRLGKGLTLDVPGLLAVIVGTASLLTAFSESSNWGWTSWETLSLTAVGVLVVVYFVLRTLRVSNPLLNLRLFATSRFTYGLIVNCTITISLYAGTFLVPVYMQNVLMSSSLHTALVMLPGTIAMALLAPVVGKLYDKLGPFRLVLAGVVLLCASTWMLSRLNLVSSTTFIVVWIAVRYIGVALSNMPVTNTAMKAVPSQLSGQASALLNWIRQGTAALSVSIFSTLLTSRTADHAKHAPAPTSHATPLSLGIHDIFVIGTVLVALTLPLTLLLRQRSGSPGAAAAASAGGSR
ncbi:MDR family MFS transporter [Paenibacillus cymbidii]|uniref:MDR family MFS transporter n=1 Tax=Paenibacillus cymbidii TaxID=1639034 RepID=UPI0010805A55|nr:MDR family MFS transporter [Paenibacillus cymbidii]